MHRQDLLWKAVIEDYFLDLLEFFYPSFLPQIDLAKGFEFLDKELQQLYTDSEEENRRADKLVKVFFKDNTERWLLIHIEVQGYQDSNFARRMFTTYYRAVDRFNKPVEALVIYTDRNQKNHFNHYESVGLKTKLRYDFHTFEITSFSVEEYEAMQNPFALVFQTALLGIKRNWKDEELLQMKVALFRKLLEKGYAKSKIRHLASFIKVYVSFSNKEFNRKFDELTEVISQNPQNMGIIETILYINKEEGKAIGKKIGEEVGEEKTLLTTRLQMLFNLLQFKVSIKKIAALVKLKEVFIKEFQQLMTEKLLQQLIKQINTFYSELDMTLPKKAIQKQLIQLFIPYQFSDKALGSFFNVRSSTVKKIREALN